MNRNAITAVAFLVMFAGLGAAYLYLSRDVAAQARNAAQAPAFEVDPLWPKPLPNHWVLGSTIGVSVDESDHIWIIHRSSATLGNNEKGLELKPPTGECCAGAPPVLEFDQAGNLLNHWGGPGQGYEWPSSNHGITVDYKGNVWIGGNGEGDAQLLKFTKSGKFLLQVGKANARAVPADKEGVSKFGGNSNDNTSFGRVAKIFEDPKENEAFISDGYLNKRVVVLNADTGAFKRYWGAYGNKPDDTNLGPYNPDAPPAPQFRNPVHCAELSVDRLLYVCDRVNDRIQVFKPDGTYIKEVFINKETLGSGSAWDIAFSKDAQQKYIYLADGENDRVHVIDRQSLELLTSFGEGGRQPGEFYGVHSLATDSKGNL